MEQKKSADRQENGLPDSFQEIWRCINCGCLIAINEGVEDENGERHCDACASLRM